MAAMEVEVKLRLPSAAAHAQVAALLKAGTRPRCSRRRLLTGPTKSCERTALSPQSLAHSPQHPSASEQPIAHSAQPAAANAQPTGLSLLKRFCTVRHARPSSCCPLGEQQPQQSGEVGLLLVGRVSKKALANGELLG